MVVVPFVAKNIPADAGRRGERGVEVDMGGEIAISGQSDALREARGESLNEIFDSVIFGEPGGKA